MIHITKKAVTDLEKKIESLDETLKNELKRAERAIKKAEKLGLDMTINREYLNTLVKSFLAKKTKALDTCDQWMNQAARYR